MSTINFNMCDLYITDHRCVGDISTLDCDEIFPVCNKNTEKLMYQYYILKELDPLALNFYNYNLDYNGYDLETNIENYNKNNIDIKLIIHSDVGMRICDMIIPVPNYNNYKNIRDVQNIEIPSNLSYVNFIYTTTYVLCYSIILGINRHKIALKYLEKMASTASIKIKDCVWDKHTRYYSVNLMITPKMMRL